MSMSHVLVSFLERYRTTPFSHAAEIFGGLDHGTVRLARVSADVPCGIYAELFDSKARHLEALAPCPEPELRDEWRAIAKCMAEAPGDEICQEWTFIGDRFSYTVYEVRQSHVIAGCETDDLVAREARLAKFAAIGVTFSLDAVREIGTLLKDECFSFGAEGTGASGYELYTARKSATEAIELLMKSDIMGRHKIELYRTVRGANEGTRYDRLLDHFEGEDPDRPSYVGIKFDL